VACRCTTPIRREHRESSRILTEYLTRGDFVEAALENWDGEFLQMVALIAYLFQNGLSESKPIATRRRLRGITPRRACGAIGIWCL
jgi:hypothetical protein